MGDLEKTLKIENDDIRMKTQHILSHFGSTFGTLGFHEKSFFKTLLSFTPYWSFKPTNAIHADRPGVYIIEKILNLGTKDKAHIKSSLNDGSLVNGLKQPIKDSLNLDKPP